MSSIEMGSVVLTLCVLLFSIHSLGYLFDKLKQPKLVGEILAGILLGPFVLGEVFPVFSKMLFGSTEGFNKMDVVLNFMYWIGLIFLMFISGSEARKLVAKENRKGTAWLLSVGTPMPFIIVMVLGFASLLPLELITGTANQQTSALLVLAIAASVTSIPVISRIFYDLGIINTRFASLILGSAVLEDIILWGVLAVASALAASATLAQDVVVKDITSHVLSTFLFMGCGLTFIPSLLARLNKMRWNFLINTSKIGYILFILFAYTSVAAFLNVNLVFAAFIAGFGVIGGVGGPERERFADALDSIAKVAFGIFIPVYFAMVGYKLILGREFSLSMLIIFLLASSILALIANGIAAKLAGFKGLDIINLAVTTNARGGPGIVLASVAYDAGIINAAFYTTLVFTAIFTSQAAQVWLRFVLSKGWPLLSTDESDNQNNIDEKVAVSSAIIK
ncbi:MAG: cation:proton antiporter [Bacteriovoracia bacterium]